MIWLIVISCLAATSPALCRDEPKLIGWPLLAARDVPDCAAIAHSEIADRADLFDGRRIIEWRCESHSTGDGTP